MDDQQTYLLNGLLTRNFDLGRISRFRQVPRGAQATTYEILTSQHHEYLVYLYPPAFSPDQLNFAAQAINILNHHRFSVVPLLPVKSPSGRGVPSYIAEGPQGTTMQVSLATAGSALPADQYTRHDISQVGLRLAWLHRLLKEQLPAPTATIPLALRLNATLADPESRRHLPNIPTPLLNNLLATLNLQPTPGWAHGHIQPAALLVDSDHQLRTLVDFALLHHGSPLEDLIDALLSLCLDPTGSLNQPRGKALLESYDSLIPLKQIPWTPIVATWCAQRLLDSSRRPLPKNFSQHLTAPENLATALASCL